MKTLSFKAKCEESALGVKSLLTIKKGKSKENGHPGLCTDPKGLQELKKRAQCCLGSRKEETELEQNKLPQNGDFSQDLFFFS